jgi:hypothetical protein
VAIVPDRPLSSFEPATVPSIARMYDYFLGGHHNFPVDREAAERVAALYPDLPLVLQANRAFLRRVVTYVVTHGVEQILDLGSGIPTVGNVHQVVESLNLTAQVVYVDIDPVAVTHSSALLSDKPNATAVAADALKPRELLDNPDVLQLISLDRPLAVLLIAFLHFVTDDSLALQVVRTLRDAIPSGSYIALSHMVPAESHTVEAQTKAADVYSQTTAPIVARTPEQISRFFEGLELVPPGLVPLPLWHPETPDDLFLDTPWRSSMVGGIGRKA